jgi:hypothetical protein
MHHLEESAADHDFRRVYAHDINPNVSPGGPVIAVVCCHCGKSPLEVLEGLVIPEVTEDWPFGLRITAFYHDLEKGSSVEFERRPGVSRIA